MTSVKTMTCPRMVKWVLLEMGGYLFALVFFALFGFFNRTDYLILMLSIFIEVGAIALIVYQFSMWKRVFLRVFLDEKGVRNCYCALEWKDIQRLEISEASYRYYARGFGERSVEKMGLMICLYRDNDSKALEFYTYEPIIDLFSKKTIRDKEERYPLNDRIFLPYTEKTVALIRAHAPHLLQKAEQ